MEGGGKCRVGVGFLAFLLVIYVAASNKEELCVCVCVCVVYDIYTGRVVLFLFFSFFFLMMICGMEG